MSVRRLEAETTCKILIRGRGSVKVGNFLLTFPSNFMLIFCRSFQDPNRQEYLLCKDKDSWRHLNEPLHVYVSALDSSVMRCRVRLEYAVSERCKRFKAPS